MNGYKKREIRPRPITAGTISGGKIAAATPAITPNPSRKRPKRTMTTKYSPNAFHLNPLVSFHERPTPSVPPGSGSSTAACTATARPHATASPDGPAVRAAPRDRDAGAPGARARARRRGIPHRRRRVRRGAAGGALRRARPGAGGARDGARNARAVVDARRRARAARPVPPLLGLLPAVRSAQPRPDARQAPHGHSRGDGYRAPDHVRGGRGAQPDPRGRRAPVRPGGPRLRAVPPAEQAARRHRGRNRRGARPARRPAARRRPHEPAAGD